MSKKCAKCEKVVYPAEELKCLDKVWHKMCFKCTECGMALTMKNYKGFDKLPYCSAHYPQLRATVVADTPELKRLDQLSKQQSQVEYHRDYEANKGNMISVAEDPEMARMKQMANVLSPASYTGTRNRDSDAADANYVRPMRSSVVDDESPQTRDPPRSYMPANAMRLPSVSPAAAAPPPPVSHPPVAPAGPVYHAMYDYDAQDDDEVSFIEGDVIINCQAVDEGWVIGVVKRTNQKGMIPSNYIELED